MSDTRMCRGIGGRLLCLALIISLGVEAQNAIPDDAAAEVTPNEVQRDGGATENDSERRMPHLQANSLAQDLISGDYNINDDSETTPLTDSTERHGLGLPYSPQYYGGYHPSQSQAQSSASAQSSSTGGQSAASASASANSGGVSVPQIPYGPQPYVPRPTPPPYSPIDYGPHYQVRIVSPNELIYLQQLPGAEYLITCRREGEFYNVVNRWGQCLVCACVSLSGPLRPVCVSCAGCKAPLIPDVPVPVPKDVCRPLPANKPFQNPLNPCQICICNNNPFVDKHITCVTNPQCVPPVEPVIPPMPYPPQPVPTPHCRQFPRNVFFPHPTEPCVECKCIDSLPFELHPRIICVRIPQCNPQPPPHYPWPPIDPYPYPGPTPVPVPPPGPQPFVPIPPEPYPPGPTPFVPIPPPPYVPIPPEPYPPGPQPFVPIPPEPYPPGPQPFVPIPPEPYPPEPIPFVPIPPEPYPPGPTPFVPIPPEPYPPIWPIPPTPPGPQPFVPIPPEPYPPGPYPVPIPPRPYPPGPGPTPYVPVQPLPWPPHIRPNKWPILGPLPHTSCSPYPTNSPFQHPWDECQICTCAQFVTREGVSIEVNCYTSPECCIEVPGYNPRPGPVPVPTPRPLPGPQLQILDQICENRPYGAGFVNPQDNCKVCSCQVFGNYVVSVCKKNPQCANNNVYPVPIPERQLVFIEPACHYQPPHQQFSKGCQLCVCYTVFTYVFASCTSLPGCQNGQNPGYYPNNLNPPGPVVIPGYQPSGSSSASAHAEASASANQLTPNYYPYPNNQPQPPYQPTTILPPLVPGINTDTAPLFPYPTNPNQEANVINNYYPYPNNQVQPPYQTTTVLPYPLQPSLVHYPTNPNQGPIYPNDYPWPPPSPPEAYWQAKYDYLINNPGSDNILPISPIVQSLSSQASASAQAQSSGGQSSAGAGSQAQSSGGQSSAGAGSQAQSYGGQSSANAAAQAQAGGYNYVTPYPQQNSQLYPQLYPQQNPQLYPQQNSQLYPQVYPQQNSQLYPQVYPQQNSQLYPQQNSQLYPQQYPQQNNQLYPQLYPQQYTQGGSVSSQASSQASSGGGQTSASASSQAQAGYGYGYNPLRSDPVGDDDAQNSYPYSPLESIARTGTPLYSQGEASEENASS